MPSQVYLTVPGGDDVTVNMQVFQADGVTPLNLAGLTPAMVIKPAPAAADATAITTLTTASGLTVTNAALGTLTALLPHGLLTGAPWNWFWRLSVTDGSGDRSTAMYGPLAVFPV